MDIKPLSDHLILEPLDAPEKIGSIIIAEANQEKIRARAVAMVSAIGPRVNEVLQMLGNDADHRGEGPLKVGDVVIYWKQASSWVPGLNTKPYIYVRAEHIVGIVTRDPHASAKEVQEARDRGRKIQEQMHGPQLVSAAGMPAGLTIPE